MEGEEGESLLKTRLQSVGRRAAEEVGHLREEGGILLGVPDELEEIDAVGLEAREGSLSGFLAGDFVPTLELRHAVLLPSSPFRGSGHLDYGREGWCKVYKHSFWSRRRRRAAEVAIEPGSSGRGLGSCL